MGYFFILRNSKIPKTKNITNFSWVLGAAAPKGLGRSPYKICELDLSSLKASKILEFLRMNLEFPRINLEFLEIASAFSKPRNDGDLMRLLPLLCSLAMTQGILEFLEIASLQ